jgi:hypothetical protein
MHLLTWYHQCPVFSGGDKGLAVLGKEHVLCWLDETMIFSILTEDETVPKRVHIDSPSWVLAMTAREGSRAAELMQVRRIIGGD